MQWHGGTGQRWHRNWRWNLAALTSLSTPTESQQLLFLNSSLFPFPDLTSFIFSIPSHFILPSFLQFLHERSSCYQSQFPPCGADSRSGLQDREESFDTLQRNQGYSFILALVLILEALICFGLWWWCNRLSVRFQRTMGVWCRMWGLGFNMIMPVALWKEGSDFILR